MRCGPHEARRVVICRCHCYNYTRVRAESGIYKRRGTLPPLFRRMIDSDKMVFTKGRYLPCNTYDDTSDNSRRRVPPHAGKRDTQLLDACYDRGITFLLKRFLNDGALKSILLQSLFAKLPYV